MERKQFVDAMKRYLSRENPKLDPSLLTPGASLWELGYVDSLRTVELILFVEKLIGREIGLDGSDVRTFTSIQAIYDAHVGPAAGEHPD